jgi:hypothetical protein
MPPTIAPDAWIKDDRGKSQPVQPRSVVNTRRRQEGLLTLRLFRRLPPCIPSRLRMAGVRKPLTIPAVRGTTIEPQGSTLLGHPGLCARNGSSSPQTGLACGGQRVLKCQPDVGKRAVPSEPAKALEPFTIEVSASELPKRILDWFPEPPAAEAVFLLRSSRPKPKRKSSRRYSKTCRPGSTIWRRAGLATAARYLPD